MAMKCSNQFLVSASLLFAHIEYEGQIFGEAKLLSQNKSLYHSIPWPIHSTHFSEIPSDQPSRTINPTRSPSDAPTFIASRFPTGQPTTAYSDQPSKTINPSRSPSTVPTVAPVVSMKPSVFLSPRSASSTLEIRLVFSITLDMHPSDVPFDPLIRDAFVDVIRASFVELLGKVIKETISDPGLVRLQGENDIFLNMNVVVVISKACYDKDCIQFSKSMLSNIQQQMDTGVLAETMNQVAQAKNVTTLATADVLFCKMIDQTIMVDGTFISSSPSRTFVLFSFALAMAISAVIF